MTILILAFSGYYIYYNTSLTQLSVGELLSGDVTIGKYLKCAKEGERARADINNAIPAYCCRGLKLKFSSGSLMWPMPGEVGVCVK